MYFKPQTSKIILFCALFLLTFNSFSQQIGVVGNGSYISDNDITPNTNDNTNFGTETSKTFSVCNIQGGAPSTLIITSIILSNTADFTISSPLVINSLDRGKCSSFTISYVGNPCKKTSTVTIASNAGNDGADNVWIFTISSKAPEINVLGNAVSILDGDLTPTTADNTDFGSTDTGVPVIKTYTVQNTGNCTLSIGSFTFTGANASEFTLETAPASTVNAGSSTTFQVKFLPITEGTRTATLSFVNNDSNENPYNFDIQGTSIVPLTEGPGGVTGSLKLWLKSTSGLGYSDGASVSLWQTQARGSNATVNTIGQEPTYRDAAAYNINFNPVVDFENIPNSPNEINYSYLPQEYLEGTSGFYTQDIFIVTLPNITVDSSTGAMDMFTGDADSSANALSDKDVTGVGYGMYSERFDPDNEIISYCINTTPGTVPPDINDRGYGVSHSNNIDNYTSVGIINARNNGTSTGQELYYNANNIANTEVGLNKFLNVENSRFWIGRSQSYRASYFGRIAEIITYSSRKDDTSERNKIESYLAIKYGITLADAGIGTTKDYVNSDGALIWDHTSNAGYNYDIAGIGRDDVSALNQKQSSSINNATDATGPIEGILTIGLADIYTTNSENILTNSSNTLGNKQFLVWGNNGLDLSLTATTINVDMSDGIAGLSTPVTFTGMQRIWKVVETGGDVSKVKISIPKNAVRNINPPGSYLMFISDTDIFDPTADYRVMTEVAGNLYTDYDFDSTKYITFGYAPETIVERSIYFDGVVDYVDMEDALDLNTSEFTVSAWIKRGVGSVNKSILSKRDASYTEGYDFKINGSGQVEMSWGVSGAQNITSTTIIPIDEWHQVAVIYNGGSVNLYIDGVLDKTASLSAPVDTTQSFFIAAAGKNTPTAFFEGNIDEVRVWNVALSIDQLRYIMNQELIDKSITTGLNPLPLIKGYVIPASITKNEISAIPWSSLAGYYPMSVYTYTNTNDMSGNGNQGALRNLNTVDYQTAPLPYKSTTDGAWDTPATWLNNSVQSIPNSLSIVDGITPVDWNIVEISDNTVLTSGSRDIKVLGLNIQSTTVDAIDTKLTMDGDNTAGTGNGLTVTHYLKLDGVIDLQGESQLIQTTDSDLDAASTGIIERDQQGTGNSFRYNYWSSPVNSRGTKFTIGEVLKDGTDPIILQNIDFGAANAYAYADGATTSPIKLSAYWMYVLRNSGLGYSAWARVGNTGELLVGEGYTMKGSNTSAAEQNYAFVGKPNNGTFNLPVSANNEYLVGNPYASAIDAYQFIDDNGPTGTASLGNGGRLIFWEHYGGDTHNLRDYQGGYAILTKASGVPASSNVPAGVSTLGITAKGAPERYVPVGQSFFVEGSLTGGNIQFNNGQRIFEKESSGNSIFMKNSTAKSNIVTANRTDLRPKFRIGFDAPAINHRQLLLTIDENTSDAVDWGYEAEIYEIISDDMYWMIDSKKYVIQATNSLSLDKEIPLGIETKEGGAMKIKVDALENVAENTSIYILDNLTGETYNITNQTFEINLEAGEYKERFVLTFQPRLKTLEEVTLIEGVHIFMNNTISELELNRIVDTEIQSVTLFNYLGQQVNTWNSGLNERFVSLPIHISTGVYIAQVHTTAGILTKKIIIE